MMGNISKPGERFCEGIQDGVRDDEHDALDDLESLLDDLNKGSEDGSVSGADTRLCGEAICGLTIRNLAEGFFDNGGDYTKTQELAKALAADCLLLAALPADPTA